LETECLKHFLLKPKHPSPEKWHLSLVVGGLIFAGLWTFAEISVARPVGIAILALSLAITLIHIFTLYLSASRKNL